MNTLKIDQNIILNICKTTSLQKSAVFIIIIKQKTL